MGADGPTHHGLFDFAFLRTVPNIIVMAPKDENELQHMLKTAVTCGRPVSLRYPRGKGVGATLDEKPRAIPVGKGEILRDSPDAMLAVVAIGTCVHPALAAAELLQAEGIPVRVINARFVKPLDAGAPLRHGATVRADRHGRGEHPDGRLRERGSRTLRGTGDQAASPSGASAFRTSSPSMRPRRNSGGLYGIDAEGIAAAVREMLDR